MTFESRETTPPDQIDREQIDDRTSAGVGPGALVRSDADLVGVWRALIAPDPLGRRAGGALERTLWLAFLDADDRVQPTVFPIDHLPQRPDHKFLPALAGIVESLIDGGLATSVPVLLQRSGPPSMDDSDRAWARAVRQALGPPARRWPVHLAVDAEIRVFAPDDLIGPADAAEG